MSKRAREAVLIVDDHQYWRDILAEPLAEEYEVKLAGSYAEALKLLRTQTPSFHVAVIDISLAPKDDTNEDGFRLIEELNRMGKSTTVIAITAFNPERKWRKSFRKLGVFDFIAKSPKRGDFDDEEFRLKVREAAVEAERQAFAFVLMPFAKEYEDIYTGLVKETVQGQRIECKRADDRSEPGWIMDDVRSSIKEAKFIIADLSGRNPNVFYEVGMAHAIGQTVLLLTQSMGDVPPGLRNARTIVYRNNLGGAERLKSELARAVQSLQQKGYKLNPLFSTKSYEPEPALCVALVPEGDSGQEVYTQIIKEVANQHDLTCINYRSIFSLTSVIDSIWDHLNKARVIIADLSGKDPDIFYLTGISHALKKDVILLARDEEDIPFDLRGPAHIIYSDQSYSEGIQSRNKLAEVLKQVLDAGLDV